MVGSNLIAPTRRIIRCRGLEKPTALRFFALRGILELWVRPARLKGRLQSMAEKEALIVIPENLERIPTGEKICVQLLAPPPWKAGRS